MKNLKNQRIWKIIEDKKTKDILNLKCCVQIKEKNKIIGSIDSVANKIFSVSTREGTGTHKNSFEECIDWLQMLHCFDILQRKQEIIIKN